jgi:hypothetical protein
LQRGYDAAAAGGVVELAAGSYPSQSVSGSKAAPGVVFRPAAGASVSLGYLQIHASNLELRGMNVDSYDVYADSNGFTARGLVSGVFGIWGSSNTSIIGGSVGPSYTPGGSSPPVYITYGNNGTVAPSNLLIDGVAFHDFRRGSVADHMECIMVIGGDGITIRNSTFNRCDIFDIFFTQWAGPNPPTNVLLENNFFGATTTDGQPGGTSLSVQLSSHMNVAKNFTLRNNSFAMPLGIDSPVSNVTITGNAMAYSGCVSGVSYSYNVIQDNLGGHCSASDTVVSGNRYDVDQLGFVDPANGDLHLKSTSPAIDKGNPSNYPTSDIDGQTRPLGNAPDAGADEVR